MTSEKKVYLVSQRKQDDFILSRMIIQCKTVNSRNISRMMNIIDQNRLEECNTNKNIAWRDTCRSTENVYQQIKMILRNRFFFFSFSRTAVVTI